MSYARCGSNVLFDKNILIVPCPNFLNSLYKDIGSYIDVIFPLYAVYYDMIQWI